MIAQRLEGCEMNLEELRGKIAEIIGYGMENDVEELNIADQILSIPIGGEVKAKEYCDECEHLSLKESEQTSDKQPHKCKLSGKQVYHLGSHPHIIARCTRPRLLKDCVDEK